ncbi:MAG: galactokinase [Lachnospiraceae bacterium]|nr:galactokinase [Lachnospiraceae bacterium]
MEKNYLTQQFIEKFGRNPQFFQSAPGRVELLGNHTDHQGGSVLAASVSMTMDAAFSPNGGSTINIISEGFPSIRIDGKDLQPQQNEAGSSAALVRGIAAGFAQALAKKTRTTGLEGWTEVAQDIKSAGFDAFITSDVLPGSGLSSSAAFEVLIGRILRQTLEMQLGMGRCSIMDDVEIAKIGQKAENFYYGKPCGLMDQMACSIGNIITIDFADASAPKVEQISFDFEKAGYALCVLDSGADHAGLTEDYASIPEEMNLVAAYFGKQQLSKVKPENAIISGRPSPELISAVGLRPALRAFHYFQEVFRVKKAVNALNRNDITTFLDQVNASGLSSRDVLQNMISSSHPENKKYFEAYEFVRKLLDGRGAVRINGGGFAGTILVFVPKDRLTEFQSEAEAVLGPNTCHILKIG